VLTRIKRWLNRNQPPPPAVPLPSPEELIQMLDENNYVLERGYVTHYDEELNCYTGCLIAALAWLKGAYYPQFSDVYPEVEEPLSLEAGFEGCRYSGDTSSPYYQYGQRVAELAGLND
jgi:hypothetical protein